MDRRELIKNLSLVSAGAFFGAICRYSVEFVTQDLVATIVVNSLGSFLLGMLIYSGYKSQMVSDKVTLVAGTGFISSFTTYSTFALQTFQSDPMIMVGNIAVNYLLGMLGVVTSRRIVRWYYD